MQFLFCAPTPRTTALVKWHIADPGDRKSVCGFPRPFGGWELKSPKIARRKLCRSCRAHYDNNREFMSRFLSFPTYRGVQTSRIIRDAIYERDGYKCLYCLEFLTGRTASLDHVIPHSEGGANLHTNLVAACRDCNSTRNARPISEFSTETQQRILAALAKPLEFPADLTTRPI